MSSTILSDMRKALIDISQFAVSLDGGDAMQPETLTRQVAALLTAGPGYCVGYGSNKALAAQGLNIRASRETAYRLLESVFRGAMAHVALEAFAVTPRAMTLGQMDVDGFNLNPGFSHDGSIASRAFMTTKCLHFDAATPFVANIYGLNENIGGGYPLMCDVRSYCADHGVAAGEIVEPIQNNYNIAIQDGFYGDLLEGYTVALDFDLSTDMIVIMMLNEIDFGVAHGATDSYKLDPDKPCARPIRHFEYQYGEEAHYLEWYDHYRLNMVDAKDYAGENLSLAYHGSLKRPFERVMRVGG